MKKPFTIMISLIAVMAILLVVAIGAYDYVKHSKTTAAAKVLSPVQAKALQVGLPQLTTNLKNAGLIQFTLTIQASNAATKKEVLDLQPEVQDVINETMRQFTAADLSTEQGYVSLKASIVKAIDGVLPKGSVSAVYLSEIVVQ